jgi:hypothetical protein
MSEVPTIISIWEPEMSFYCPKCGDWLPTQAAYRRFRGNMDSHHTCLCGATRTSDQTGEDAKYTTRGTEMTDLNEILAIASYLGAYDRSTLSAAKLRALVTEHKALREALVAVCERGDTDHSAKAMYWIASDALKAIGLNSLGKSLGEAK